MKSLKLFLLLLSFSVVNAQTSVREKISIKIDTVSVPKYEFETDANPDYKTIKIEVGFGDFALVNKKDADILTNAVIKSIDLVYTKYPIEEDFSELNRRRIEYLHLLCPSIFNNTMTKWRIISQTACKNESTARHLFHGFYVTYKPAPTIESAAREMASLKDIYTSKRPLKDSSVYKIFVRNKWKNMTVATDFTGSMSPYIGQVLLWYKLTFATKDFSEFVFFNDGDRASDSQKKTGKTGGIYYCNSNNKDTVLQTAFRCSRNGFGGDIQENNIEACLLAIERNPGLKEIIMIADNWAPMRDYALLSKIKIPVHVIICGLEPGFGINTEYLDLARHTKGSVHTIEEDISGLAKIAEGKSIEIGGSEYRLMAGRFIKMNKS